MAGNEQRLPVSKLVDVAEGHGVRECEVERVIRVVASRGLGDADSPIRTVTSWFTLDGRRLVEEDPCA